MKQFVLSLLVLGATDGAAWAQSLEYRASIAEEGTHYVLNNSTPFNYQNLVVPQPGGGNVGTAGAFIGYGALSTSLSFTTKASNLTSPEYDFTVRELSMDLSLSDEINLLIGKKILKWGTGYAFNPTGVVEPQHSPSDPTDRLNQNDGRNLVSLAAFWGKSSLTLAYVNDAVVTYSSLRWGVSEYAIRGYTLLGGVDLALVAHYRQGDKLETGTNMSCVFGDHLELHGEILAKRGSTMLYHRSMMSDNAQQIFNTYPYVPLELDSRKVFCQALVGGQYTFDNGINLVLEYYHNNEGLSSQQWKRWMNFVKFQDGIQRGLVPVPPGLLGASRANLLWALSTLSPRGTMQDYCFARGTYSEDHWGAELMCFLNASDMSTVLVPTLTWRVSESFSAYVRFTSYQGRDDSEFGSLFTTSSVTFGIGVQI